MNATVDGAAASGAGGLGKPPLNALPDTVAIAAGLALLAAIVFSGTGSPEVDSYYHLRYAALLDAGKLPRGAFPWASASTWATAFSDKDWLYHQALVPFVRAFGPDLLFAGKVAAFAFSGALLVGLALALAKRGAPRPGAIALLGIVSSYTLLQRVTVVRTLTPAVLFLILLFLALVERRALAVLVVATLYPLLYAAIHVPLAAGVVVALGFRLRKERLGVRTGAALAIGTALGVFLHPDFPRNLSLAWDQNARVLANAWASTPLGREQAVEFRAFSVRDVALGSFLLWLSLGTTVVLVLTTSPGEPTRRTRAIALALLGVLVGGLFVDEMTTRRALLLGSPAVLFVGARLALAIRRSTALGADAAAAVLLALSFALLSLLSVRFLEYAAPLGALALGLVTRDVLASEEARARARALGGETSPRAIVAGAVVLALAALGAEAKLIGQAFATVASAGPSRYEPAAAWIAQHARPDEVVYHARWDAFPELFYFAPGQRYLVALDPAFLYYADEHHQRYDTWDGVGRGELDPSAVAAFGARLIVTDASAPRFLALESKLRAGEREGRFALRSAAYDVEVWEVVRP